MHFYAVAIFWGGGGGHPYIWHTTVRILQLLASICSAKTVLKACTHSTNTALLSFLACTHLLNPILQFKRVTPSLVGSMNKSHAQTDWIVPSRYIGMSAL